MRATDSPGLRPAKRPPRPVVVGHRGAPAYRPEHTAASFDLAVDLGADFVEPDVVISRDGALVVRHEAELSCSTDVATRAEFAGRRTVRPVYGRPTAGWFVDDFTLAELRTLRAVESMRHLRPRNTVFDGRFGILTLAEVIDLARSRSTDERPIRVLAELKHDESAGDADLPMAEIVSAELKRLEATDARGTVMLQSFDPGLLRDLRARLGSAGPEMVQLVDDVPEDDRLVTPAGLREVSTYAQAIGPSRDRLLPVVEDGVVAGAEALVDEAHRAALSVFCWALRAENAFLPRQLRRGTAPTAHGNALGEARLLLDLGVDGLITDSPEHAVQAVSDMAALRVTPRPGAVPQLI